MLSTVVQKVKKIGVKIDAFNSGPESDEHGGKIDGFCMLQKMMAPLAKWMVSKNDKYIWQT